MCQPHPCCADCRHLNRRAHGFKCEAFPEGIPGAIADGHLDHDRPFPGDNGVRFEPIDSSPPEPTARP